ncbi:MAG: hypothetical protein HUK21_01195 [Fibrobacteraceae bacterium]|nr:hypothetical protein [Fibrobacteraceae bacterium]
MKNSKLMFKVFATLATIASFSLTGCSDSGSNASDEGSASTSQGTGMTLTFPIILDEANNQVILVDSEGGKCYINKSDSSVYWEPQVEYDTSRYILRNDTLFFDIDDDDNHLAKAMVLTGGKNIKDTWTHEGLQMWFSLPDWSDLGLGYIANPKMTFTFSDNLMVQTILEDISANHDIILYYGACFDLKYISEQLYHLCQDYFSNVGFVDGKYQLYNDETGNFSPVPATIQLSDTITITDLTKNSFTLHVGSQEIKQEIVETIDILERAKEEVYISYNGTTCVYILENIFANQNNCNINSVRADGIAVGHTDLTNNDIREIESFGVGDGYDEYTKCIRDIKDTYNKLNGINEAALAKKSVSKEKAEAKREKVRRLLERLSK